MIPIVSITDLVLAVLCFGISAKLFASYKTKPSQLMRYFLAFYLFFGISFLFFSIPEIFSKHATIITVLNILETHLCQLAPFSNGNFFRRAGYYYNNYFLHAGNKTSRQSTSIYPLYVDGYGIALFAFLFTLNLYSEPSSAIYPHSCFHYFGHDRSYIDIYWSSL